LRLLKVNMNQGGELRRMSEEVGRRLSDAATPFRLGAKLGGDVRCG
jgi:hypothetical protein